MNKKTNRTIYTLDEATNIVAKIGDFLKEYDTRVSSPKNDERARLAEHIETSLIGILNRAARGAKAVPHEVFGKPVGHRDTTHEIIYPCLEAGSLVNMYNYFLTGLDLELIDFDALVDKVEEMLIDLINQAAEGAEIISYEKKTDSAKEIKKCPWCGGPAILVGVGSQYKVLCKNNWHASSDVFDDSNDAIENWNKWVDEYQDERWINSHEYEMSTMEAMEYLAKCKTEEATKAKTEAVAVKAEPAETEKATELDGITETAEANTQVNIKGEYVLEHKISLKELKSVQDYLADCDQINAQWTAKTVMFPGGMTMNFVCNCHMGESWVEAVLKDTQGRKVCSSKPRDTILGTWVFIVGDIRYKVDLAIETAFVETAKAKKPEEVTTMHDAGKAEFDYIMAFAREMTDFVGQRDQLRSLWTAYCLHQDMEPDTAPYDREISAIFKVVDSRSFNAFDLFMGELLV